MFLKKWPLTRFSDCANIYTDMYIYSDGTIFWEAVLSDVAAVATPDEPEFLFSYSHAPSPAAQRVFNVVLHSGHFRAGCGRRVDRHCIPGHELLCCVSGNGYVLSGTRRFRVEPFQIAWVSGSSSYVADEDSAWEVLWMQIAGHQVDHTSAILAVQRRPIFEKLRKHEACQLFHRVNALLSDAPSAPDVALNCCVAELLRCLVESRQVEQPLSNRSVPNDYPELRHALKQMGAKVNRSWRAAELAKLCGLSERHFFRLFREQTGLSPIDWLKRERIKLAQKKLLENDSYIKEIAAEVGFNDVYFFSREFKRYTGFTPARYRREKIYSATTGRASTPLP